MPITNSPIHHATGPFGVGAYSTSSGLPRQGTDGRRSRTYRTRGDESSRLFHSRPLIGAEVASSTHRMIGKTTIAFLHKARTSLRDCAHSVRHHEQ